MTEKLTPLDQYVPPMSISPFTSYLRPPRTPAEDAAITAQCITTRYPDDLTPRKEPPCAT